MGQPLNILVDLTPLLPGGLNPTIDEAMRVKPGELSLTDKARKMDIL